MNSRTFTALFHRNRRLLGVTLALIIVSGLGAFKMLPRMEDPRFANRYATIITRLPGASSERVESLVTEKIEEYLQEIHEVNQIDSHSRTGISVILVELDDYVTADMVESVWSRVRDKLDGVRIELPADAGDPDFDYDESYAYTLILALTWNASDPVNEAILHRTAQDLEDRLRAVPGTEHTNLFGESREQVLVEVDAVQLAMTGRTPIDLARTLRAADAKTSAGVVRSAAGDLLVEVRGEIRELDRIREIILARGEGHRTLTVGDIATVRKTVADPPHELALFNSRRGIAIAARMGPHERINWWKSRIDEVVRDYEMRLSAGLELQVLFDQERYTSDRLSGLTRNFLLAVLAVMAVVFLTMGGRSALAVGSALPLSALMVLSGMYHLGIPIHQMSITGLIIALGMLIDNAIVITDELQRKLADGVETSAAIDGIVRRLAIPLLGSTLTTVLAFMPIAIMPGGAGEFVGGIAICVILAVTSSFLLSLTIVPAIVGLLMGNGGNASGGLGLAECWVTPGMKARFGRWIRHLLTSPVSALTLSFALPGIGFWVGGQLPEQFFPAADRDQFHVHLRLPRQSSIHETRQRVDQATDILRTHAQVDQVHFFLGNNAPLFYYNLITGEDGSAFYAHGLVQLKSSENCSRVIRELQEAMQSALPGVDVLALQLEQGPPFKAPIELRLLGPDLDTLRRLGEEARAVLVETPHIISTRASLADSRPKLRFDLDEARALSLGLSNTAIARQLDASLEGYFGGSLLEDNEELPILIRTPRPGDVQPDQIDALDLHVPSHNWERGQPVPLSALGHPTLLPQVAGIDRFNAERVNRVLGFVPAGMLPSKILAAYQDRLKQSGFKLPPGYSLEWGGESGERDEAVAMLMSSVAVLGILMITALVLSLSSFRLAGIILGVALASIGLGLGALWLFGYPFGFMAIVGIMGLVGVAINDSIVVLSALRHDEEALRGNLSAITRVVQNATRHVLTTTLTTVAGFLPLILTGGLFWRPLAVAIAGGVVGATLLALVFVPFAFRAVYTHRARDWRST